VTLTESTIKFNNGTYAATSHFAEKIVETVNPFDANAFKVDIPIEALGNIPQGGLFSFFTGRAKES
jgi:hypothetical protein